MEKTTRRKILLILLNQGSIVELIKDGYTYGQIATMINELVAEEFIIEIEDELVLTAKGEGILIESNGKGNFKGIEQWIVPDEKSRSQKLEENELYLPNRNELHF